MHRRLEHENSRIIKNKTVINLPGDITIAFTSN
jgi:hypothetical protein